MNINLNAGYIKNTYRSYRFMINKSFEYLKLKGNCWFITIIDYSENFATGSLMKFKMENWKQRLARQLKSMDIEYAAGIIEICLRVNKKEPCDDKKWWPHIHLIVVSELSKNQLRTNLKRYYPCKPDLYHPIKIKNVDDSANLAAYITKNPAKSGKMTRSEKFTIWGSSHDALPASERDELGYFLRENSSLQNGTGNLIFSLGLTKRGLRWWDKKRCTTF